jgi:hypothetical protein
MEHALPDKLRRNRTHLVWNGEASPSLQRLIALLQPLPAPVRRAAAERITG